MMRYTGARSAGALGYLTCGMLLAMILALGVCDARATSLRPMSLRELVQRSQKIVRGTISRADCEADARHRLWTLYTLQDASAAKGSLTARRVFHFRCLGGERDGYSHRMPGVPELEVGDDVVIFYAPDNAACQVMGWMQGHFRTLPAPSGLRNVFNHQDLPVVGVSTDALLLGSRPAWLHRESPQARFVSSRAFAFGDAADGDDDAQGTRATPEDFMIDLHALARFHPDLAPIDRASEGTETVIGTLPDLRPVNPLVSGPAQ
jgi:hypothetical protein